MLAKTWTSHQYTVSAMKRALVSIWNKCFRCKLLVVFISVVNIKRRKENPRNHESALYYKQKYETALSYFCNVFIMRYIWPQHHISCLLRHTGALNCVSGRHLRTHGYRSYMESGSYVKNVYLNCFLVIPNIYFNNEYVSFRKSSGFCSLERNVWRTQKLLRCISSFKKALHYIL